MTVDDVTDTLKGLDGDIKSAVVIATCGNNLATIVCGDVREVSAMLTIAAIKDEDIRRAIGYTAIALNHR